MNLASSKVYKKLTATKKPPSNIKRKLPHSDFDNWIEMSGTLREEDVIRKAQLRVIAKFMRQVLPEPPVQRFDRITPSMKRRESLLTATAEIAPKKPKFEIDDAEEEVIDLDTENYGELASLYLKPYQHNAKFLDKK